MRARTVTVIGWDSHRRLPHECGADHEARMTSRVGELHQSRVMDFRLARRSPCSVRSRTPTRHMRRRGSWPLRGWLRLPRSSHLCGSFLTGASWCARDMDCRQTRSRQLRLDLSANSLDFGLGFAKFQRPNAPRIGFSQATRPGLGRLLQELASQSGQDQTVGGRQTGSGLEALESVLLQARLHEIRHHYSGQERDRTITAIADEPSCPPRRQVRVRPGGNRPGQFDPVTKWNWRAHPLIVHAFTGDGLSQLDYNRRQALRWRGHIPEKRWATSIQAYSNSLSS